METITCPKCGRKLQADVITTIRDDDEKAWKALLDKTLNTCVCTKCKTRFLVERPLIYRDDKNPFIVFYVDTEESTHDMEEQIDAMAQEIADKEGIDKPVVRLALSMPEFIEKIFCWRLGYDDRLIEYTKHQLFRNVDLDKMSRHQHRLLIDFSNEEDDKLAFIIFDRETNQPFGKIHVPMEEFKNLVDEFYGNDQLMHELDLLFPTCYVSCDRLI